MPTVGTDDLIGPRCDAVIAPYKNIEGGVNMKELYTKPQTDIEKFRTVDVITTSGNDIRDDDNIVDGSDGW